MKLGRLILTFNLPLFGLKQLLKKQSLVLKNNTKKSCVCFLTSRIPEKAAQFLQLQNKNTKGLRPVKAVRAQTQRSLDVDRTSQTSKQPLVTVQGLQVTAVILLIMDRLPRILRTQGARQSQGKGTAGATTLLPGADLSKTSKSIHL